MHSPRLCGIVLAIACLVLPQKAETQVAVTPEARVRVVERLHFRRRSHVDSATLVPLGVYELVRMAGDTVIVTSVSSMPRAFVLGTERALEVSTGMRRRPLRGIGVGFLVGTADGAGRPS